MIKKWFCASLRRIRKTADHRLVTDLNIFYMPILSDICVPYPPFFRSSPP